MSLSSQGRPPVTYNTFGAIASHAPTTRQSLNTQAPSFKPQNLTPVSSNLALVDYPFLPKPSTAKPETTRNNHLKENLQKLASQAEKRNIQIGSWVNNDGSHGSLHNVPTMQSSSESSPRDDQPVTGKAGHIPGSLNVEVDAFIETKPSADGEESSLHQQLESKEPQLAHDVSQPELFGSSGDPFLKHELYYQNLVREEEAQARLEVAISDTIKPRSARERMETQGYDMTRILLPIIDNLRSYHEGPEELRGGYFAPWYNVNAPAYAIDVDEAEDVSEEDINRPA